jgi:ABC-2 type transport system permease protein
MKAFSLARTLAIFVKEFQQMLRDRLDLRDGDRRADPAARAVRLRDQHRPEGPADGDRLADDGRWRAAVAAMQNTGYFHITHQSARRGGEALLESGEAQFHGRDPPDFSQARCARRAPALLVAVDATDRRPRATRSPRWRAGAAGLAHDSRAARAAAAEGAAVRVARAPR